MNATKLYEKHSIAELQELRRKIENEPANRQTEGIFKYTPSARKKLEAIDWAITFHLRDNNPNPAKDFGYTGRKSNRRR